MGRALAGILVLLVLVAAWFLVCFPSNLVEPPPNSNQRPRTAAEPDKDFLECDRDLPFEPTYFPRGVDHKLRCPDPDLGLPQGIAYFGPEGRQIQIYRDQFGNRAGPFIQTHKRPIEVLGGTGTIGWIHEGFSVQFEYRGARYALYTYGIPLNQLRSFAEGLRAR